MKKLTTLLTESADEYNLGCTNCKVISIGELSCKKELDDTMLTKFNDNYEYDCFINTPDTRLLIKRDFREENRDYAIMFTKLSGGKYNVSAMVINSYYDSFVENDLDELYQSMKDFKC